MTVTPPATPFFFKGAIEFYLIPWALKRALFPRTISGRWEKARWLHPENDVEHLALQCVWVSCSSILERWGRSIGYCYPPSSTLGSNQHPSSPHWPYYWHWPRRAWNNTTLSLLELTKPIVKQKRCSHRYVEQEILVYM